MNKAIQLKNKEGDSIFPIGAKVFEDTKNNIYRKATKYADGTLICTAIHTILNQPIDITRGVLFSSDVITGADYLVPFVGEEPTVTFGVKQNASSNRLISVHPHMEDASLTKLPDFVLSSTPALPGYSNKNVAPKANFIASGKWK